MSIATLAHGARESLGRGLESLQAAGAPPALLEVAEPLARALGILARIEQNPTTEDGAAVEPALQALREGLGLLQLPEHIGHPAAERAMSAVAETLGAAVTLSEELAASASRARAAPPAQKGTGSPNAGEPPLRTVEAALGAHSATNFYKGLAGGDIVASGGLFVATYQVPEVGQKLLLKVSMPGGYEFEAKGVVAWTRDVRLSSTASGTTPGFGAQITEITDEGRGLIQRYVRNREPLFHDDL
jgi:Tfp pilus assembly protein PilZ